MKMAGFRLLLLLLACIAGVAMANLYDGLPRPPGFPLVPTMEYGPRPPCYLAGKVVNCEWYGFAHMDHLSMGMVCLEYTRAALANTTIAPPGSLMPYAYYAFDSFIFDPITNASYCSYGCFHMSSAGTPPGTGAPPPATVATPPPATVATPPPATVAIPPPVSIPPPPAPSVLVPPPPRVAPPPTPDALAPTTTAPPPPPSGTRLVNLSGAGFLPLRGIVPFVVSGALLVLGILGF